MSKKCLVLMPFSDPDGSNRKHWSSFYGNLSKRILTKLKDFECEKFELGAGVILSNLLVKIVEADLIVCNLTYMKPNVLLELGASIMLGKPTILLAQGEPAMPSDISNYAFVKYSFEKPGALTFPKNGKDDLFDKSLEFMTARYEAELFINTDSTLAKTLKAISNTLKHAIQLENENAILAPALRSLFDNLVSKNAKQLSNFIEQNLKSVTISIESPRLLFDVLIALLKDLSHDDKYDSITWREHWTGPNLADSRRFLRAILVGAEDLPQMRRVFLVGVNRLNKNSWQVDPRDQTAVRIYYNNIRTLGGLVQSRVLFLPQHLIEHVADVCHMGRITKGVTTIYVFSKYSDDGSLNSFRVVRNKTFNWDYEDFWKLAVNMRKFDWESEALAVPCRDVPFSGSPKTLAYAPALKSLLERIAV